MRASTFGFGGLILARFNSAGIWGISKDVLKLANVIGVSSRAHSFTSQVGMEYILHGLLG